MYDLKSKLFVHECCFDFPDAAQRVEATESAMRQKGRRFGDRDIPDLIAQSPWAGLRRRFGELKNPPDPDVVLVPGRWEHDSKAEKAIVDACPEGGARTLASYLLGHGAFSFFCSGQTEIAPRKDHVCRPAWRLMTMNGCPHRCAYCPLGGVLIAMANLDQYVERLDKLVENNPWETVYLFNDQADTLVLEPEINNVRRFLDYFKTRKRRYFVVHTKSANVDHLLGHEHDRRAILLWTVAGPTASRLFEPGAPTCEERLEAARKCTKAGYPVRLKFKPIIPVRNWREDATTMARLALDGMRPEVINLFTLAWMSADEVKRAFDVNEFDPELVRLMEEGRAEVEGLRTGPFPHRARAMIYDHFITEIRKVDPDVPITFSTETLDMWKEFGPRLGYKPTDYICGCGAQAEPGVTRLRRNPWKITKPVCWDGKPWQPAP
jgi:DNA repair photolyase